MKKKFRNSRPRYVLLAFGLSFAPLSVYARDASRYPEENPAHAARILVGFKGSFETFLPVEMQLGVDQTFDEVQSKLLKSAFKIFADRALKERTTNCAFRKSTKDLPESASKFRWQLYDSMALLRVDDHYFPSFAFIARYWDDSKTVGIGYVDLFNDNDRPFPGYANRHYLHIAINSDFLGEGNSYPYRIDEDYWAGVIAHEFLHNLGYRHPTGYEGSFIYEFGNCVRTNGVEAAALEGELFDRVVEKDL